MSKQAQANKIFKNGQEQNLSRKVMIEQIVVQIGVKPAYASTLYQNAKKKAAPSAPKKPTATSHSVPTPTTEMSTFENVTSFDRETLKMLRNEIDGALKETLARFGLEGELGAIRFGDNDFSSKLNVRIPGAKTIKQERAESAFKLYASSEGLDASDFGKEFTYAGREGLRIVGYNTRAKKYPIDLEDRNGGRYKVAGGQIKAALGH